MRFRSANQKPDSEFLFKEKQVVGYDEKIVVYLLYVYVLCLKIILSHGVFFSVNYLFKVNSYLTR